MTKVIDFTLLLSLEAQVAAVEILCKQLASVSSVSLIFL